MDQIQSEPVQVKDHKLMYKFIGVMVFGLVIGLAISWVVMRGSVSKLNEQITVLQGDLAKLKIENAKLEENAKKAINSTPPTSTTTPPKTKVSLYSYRAQLMIPDELRDNRSSEVIVPLGATGSYNVKSVLYNFKETPNLKIIIATDSVVYENFIRNGTQAITPDPNTLTPGNPNSINGLNFCTKLSAKVCNFDSETNTVTFEKEYQISPDNKYTVFGAAVFFNVIEDNIGSAASIAIVRVSSNNQDLIQTAKEIALSGEAK